MGTLYRRATHHFTEMRWLVHWPVMSGLLNLVQRGGAWAGCAAAAPPSQLHIIRRGTVIVFAL